MNDQVQKREKDDPTELNNPVPFSMKAIIISLIVWGLVYTVWSTVKTAPDTPAIQQPLSQATGSPKSSQAEPIIQQAKANGAIVDGKAIYEGKCAACHNSSGMGLPGVFPPLAGSNWVTTDNVQVPTQILIKGIQGSIKVNGTEYNGMMPGFGSMLSDDELAALVTYIRSQWGNSASKATVEDVVAAREALNGDTSPFKGGAGINHHFNTELE